MIFRKVIGDRNHVKYFQTKLFHFRTGHDDVARFQHALQTTTPTTGHADIATLQCGRAVCWWQVNQFQLAYVNAKEFHFAQHFVVRHSPDRYRYFFTVQVSCVFFGDTQVSVCHTVVVFRIRNGDPNRLKFQTGSYSVCEWHQPL